VRVCVDVSMSECVSEYMCLCVCARANMSTPSARSFTNVCLLLVESVCVLERERASECPRASVCEWENG